MDGKILFFFSFYFINFLAADQHWFRNAKLQKLLDQTTHSRSHENNKVDLIINGMNSFKKKLENIESANCIFLKTYEFWNDETGGEILQKLLKKAQSGAKVFIQFDVKGTLSPVHSETLTDIRRGRITPIPDYLQDFITQSNGNGYVIPTSTPYSYLTNTIFLAPLDHEKYLITWNAKGAPVQVIMGGTNTGDMYSLTEKKNENGEYQKVPFYEKRGFSNDRALPMRDTDVEVIGTVTEDILERFIDAARFQLKNPNPYFQKHLLSHVQSAIQEMEKIQQQALKDYSTAFPKDIGDAFLRFIHKSAREYKTKDPFYILNFFLTILEHVPDDAIIEFATGYLLPTKILWKKIFQAAERGVLFKVLSNRGFGPESTIRIVSMTAQSSIRSFLKSVPAGTVDFYEWRGNNCNGTSHSHQKVYSFGFGENEPCCVGSSNLDSASLMWNSEDILVIQSPQFKRQLNQMFISDFSYQNSRKVTIPELDKEPMDTKLKGVLINRLFEDFL